MKTKTRILSQSLLAIMAGTIAMAATAACAAPARRSASPASARPAGTMKPASNLTLSVGRGQLINLPAPISDVFVSNDKVADVQVKSSTQIYVFAKTVGEASVYATTKSGAVAYSANVYTGNNINSISDMLRLAMPDAQIQATTMNGMVLLTGAVAGPDDGAEAERLVEAFVGKETQVVSRLKVATPLQVNLQVKIAEVSRSLSKEIGVNLMNRDTTGGFLFGLSQGRNFGSIGTATLDPTRYQTLDASTLFGLPAGSIRLPFDTSSGQFVNGAGTAYNFSNLGLGAGKTAIGIAGRLFGIDAAAALDFAEKEGLVTTLAQPNLTALSGETASFLAGGEIPIPISQSLGALSVEYKQYGVSLSFTPTVLSDGRISMRVRPEVSDLSAIGTVRLNGFDIPGISTRRAETTVELGSGQSFMIGGLLSNANSNTIDRMPGAGNVPVLGALFRSTSFRRNESELVIIVTPYLVKPVNANEIALPTDGYKSATDLERVLLGKTESGSSKAPRPVPTMEAPSRTVAPEVGALAPQGKKAAKADRKDKQQAVAAAPGFGGN